MFPFMVFGGFLASWFESFWSSTVQGNSNNNMSYSNHIVTDGLLHVKFGIEENGKLKTSAYQDAKGVWTIGIGLVDIFDDNGKYVLKIAKGHTLAGLKLIMGKTHLSDLQFCFNLMRNHIKRSNSGKVFADLDKYRIPYDADLADAIVDFYYNSGSAYNTGSYVAFINELRRLSSLPMDKKRYAIAYLRYRLDYLQSWSPVVYGSWLRRVQIFADRISKKDVNMDNKKSWQILPTSVSVRAYVLANYFYTLKKPLK